MTRIFLTLAILGTLILGAALWLGLGIGDGRAIDAAVQQRVGIHFLVGVAALVFAVLVHALVLTYFMGTGRWLEETTIAYRLAGDWKARSGRLKYGLLPAMTLSLVLLVLTGASGAAADPASAVGFSGWGPFSAAEIHLFTAVTALVVNLSVNIWEFLALMWNGQVVLEVLQQVRRIRLERGLDV